MLAAWLTPPIVPILKVYLFNITNPAQVLEGQDPITKEIGPYVYSATHIRRLIEVLLYFLRILVDFLYLILF